MRFQLLHQVLQLEIKILGYLEIQMHLMIFHLHFLSMFLEQPQDPWFYNAKLGQLTIYGQSRPTSDIIVQKDVSNSIGRAGLYLDLDNSTQDAEARVTLERTAGTNFLGLEVYSDATSGIRFSTSASGSTSPVERMRVFKDGTVRIKILLQVPVTQLNLWLQMKTVIYLQ